VASWVDQFQTVLWLCWEGHRWIVRSSPETTCTICSLASLPLIQIRLTRMWARASCWSESLSESNHLSLGPQSFDYKKLAQIRPQLFKTVVTTTIWLRFDWDSTTVWPFTDLQF